MFVVIPRTTLALQCPTNSCTIWRLQSSHNKRKHSSRALHLLHRSLQLRLADASKPVCYLAILVFSAKLTASQDSHGLNKIHFRNQPITQYSIPQSPGHCTFVMDVADMLSHDPPHPNHPSHAVDNAQQEPRRSHHYPTRHAVLSNNIALDSPRFSNPSTNDNSSNSNPHAGFHPDYSPATPAPKNVTFELLFDGAPHYRARLPMKVGINPRDTTEDIISTVKNFYGLYEGIAKGVSFEDDRGRTMIARYDNFWNDMIIYVKVIPECSPSWQSHDQIGNHAATPTSAQRTPYLDQGYEMPPPQPAQILNYGQPISRPDSRLARKHSVSPRRNRTRRSVSAQKNRSRSDHKGHEGSFQEHLDELNSDAMKGYGSSDGEAGSVTSSRKARNEQLASSEISLANVVPGGRRQKAKFESSVSRNTIYACSSFC